MVKDHTISSNGVQITGGTWPASAITARTRSTMAALAIWRQFQVSRKSTPCTAATAMCAADGQDGFPLLGGFHVPTSGLRQHEARNGELVALPPFLPPISCRLLLSGDHHIAAGPCRQKTGNRGFEIDLGLQSPKPPCRVATAPEDLEHPRISR
jgi:hypothetical protein